MKTKKLKTPKLKTVANLILVAICGLGFFIVVDTASAAPSIVSPTPETQLRSTEVEFKWNYNQGVEHYILHLGTCDDPTGLQSCSKDIYYSNDIGTKLTTIAKSLPTDGRKIYARVWYRKTGGWMSSDLFQYTAYNPSANDGRCDVIAGETCSSAPQDCRACGDTRPLFVDASLQAKCAGNYNINNRNCSGNDGTAFKTIQAAVDAARNSDTINVRQGTYAEKVIVDKDGIKLQAYNNEKARITGDLLEGNWELVNSIKPDGTYYFPNIPEVNATGKGIYKLNFPDYRVWSMMIEKENIPRKILRLAREDATNYANPLIPNYNLNCDFEAEIKGKAAWYEVITLAKDFRVTGNRYIIPENMDLDCCDPGLCDDALWAGIEVMFHGEDDGDIYLSFRDPNTNPNNFAGKIRVSGYKDACVRLAGDNISLKGFDIDTCHYGVEINGKENVVDNVVVRGGDKKAYIKNSTGSNVVQNSELTMSLWDKSIRPGSWSVATRENYPFYAEQHSFYGFLKSVGDWNYDIDIPYACGPSTERIFDLSSAGSGNVLKNNNIYDSLDAFRSYDTPNTEIYGNTVDHIASVVYGDDCIPTVLKFHDNLVRDYNIFFRSRRQFGNCQYYFYNNKLWNPEKTGLLFKQEFGEGFGGPATLRVYHNTVAGGGETLFAAGGEEATGMTVDKFQSRYENTYVVNNIISTKGSVLQPWSETYPTPPIGAQQYNWLGSALPAGNIAWLTGTGNIWSCLLDNRTGCSSNEPRNMWDLNTRNMPDFTLPQATAAHTSGRNLKNNPIGGSNNWPGIGPNYWGGGTTVPMGVVGYSGPDSGSNPDVNSDTHVNIKDIQICIKAITAPGSIPPEQLQKCKALAPPNTVANIKDIQVIIRCILNPQCSNPQG